VRIVRITDLDSSGSLDFDSMPRMAIDEKAHSQFMLRPGDIVFARTGATVGKIALINQSSPPCIAGAYFIKLQFKDYLLPEYAYAALRTNSIQAIIVAQSRQAAQQNFSGPGLRRLPMPIPPLSLQHEFKSRMLSIQQIIALHQESLARLADLFASLQHRAFSGQL
jgi:type I restriction enzyme S subunit